MSVAYAMLAPEVEHVDLADILAALKSLLTPQRLDVARFFIDAALAILTLFAVFAAAFAAKHARRSADVAAEALARESLRSLREEFDRMGYFMRFWRLDQLTRDGDEEYFGALRIDVCVSGSGHPLTDSRFGPSDFSETGVDLAKHADRMIDRTHRNDLERIVEDAIGPEISPDRADMVSLYYFALKVASFIDRNPKWAADALTEEFGPSLLATLSNHRLLASRMVPQPHLRQENGVDYYPEAYGLKDERYARLIDSLTDSVLRLNVGTEEGSRQVEELLVDRGLASALDVSGHQKWRLFGSRGARGEQKRPAA